MPNPNKTEKEPVRETSEERRKRGVWKKFQDFARATDEVETLDPTGAYIKIPTGTFSGGGYNRGHGGRDRYQVTEYGCKLIEFYACNGLSQTTIAGRLGLDKATFSQCIRHQPEVQDALAKGKDDAEYELKDCLMGMARRGNVIAAIFLLKAQHGWRDNDAPPEARPALQVVINAPLSTEDYKKLRENGVTPMLLPPPKFDQPVEAEGELVEAD